MGIFNSNKSSYIVKEAMYKSGFGPGTFIFTIGEITEKKCGTCSGSGEIRKYTLENNYPDLCPVCMSSGKKLLDLISVKFEESAIDTQYFRVNPNDEVTKMFQAVRRLKDFPQRASDMLHEGRNRDNLWLGKKIELFDRKAKENIQQKYQFIYKKFSSYTDADHVYSDKINYIPTFKIK
jgi:hypothetical protein